MGNKKTYSTAGRNQDGDNNINENCFPSSGASIMLDISKNEYSKERERANILDNKAGILISAIIAMVTLYVPIIPFSIIKKTYIESNKLSVVMLTINLCVLVLACMSIAIAFYNLYKVISVKPYLRVNFENLNDENVLCQSKENIELGLLNHFNTILIKNAEINNEKAKMLVRGLKYSILSFALISISAISLIIIVG